MTESMLGHFYKDRDLNDAHAEQENIDAWPGEIQRNE